MRIDIPMPKAGLTMVEGTISEWKAAEGALIQKGDAIMEYENEKNTIEYESVHGGYLTFWSPPGRRWRWAGPSPGSRRRRRNTTP